MARMSREVRRARAILVANQSLQERLGRIDWEEETLYPLLDKVKSGEITIEAAFEQLALGEGDGAGQDR